jgi:hypothetical protein
MDPQQKYLSTDPNAGQTAGGTYLSTDPNAGQAPTSGLKRVGDGLMDLATGRDLKPSAQPSRDPMKMSRADLAAAERAGLDDLNRRGVSRDAPIMDAMLSMAGGGVAGAGVKMLATKLLPKALQTVGNIAGQSAVGAGLSAATGGDPLAGAALGGGLTSAAAAAQGLAKPIMRGAQRVTAQIGRKHPELADAALKHRILPTEGGAAKAAKLRDQSKAANDAAVAAADPNAVALPSVMAAKTATDVAPAIRAQQISGSPATLPERVTNFGAQQSLAPSELLSARRVWNDDLGNTFQAAKFQGRSMDVDQQALRSLTRQSGDFLESVAPGFKDRSKQTSMFEGLRQAAAGRSASPATGLDDLALGYGTALDGLSPGLLAMRAVRVPAARGGAAIGLNELGKVGDNPYIRAAILQGLLGGSQEPE